MNRFQHDNIDPDLSAERRAAALKSEGRGINRMMAPERRSVKQDRNRRNRAARRDAKASK